MRTHALTSVSTLFILFATGCPTPAVVPDDGATDSESSSSGDSESGEEGWLGEEGGPTGGGSDDGSDTSGGSSDTGEDSGGSDDGGSGSTGGGSEDPYCGDGKVDPGEECDDAGESDTCDSDCTFASCGDSLVNASAGETCDDGGESATCNDDCSAASCGDGVLNAAAGEACDDGGESETCDSDCSAPACGDGVVNEAAGEACDDQGRSDACNDDCSLATCGDGVLNEAAGETCDDGGESVTCDGDCTAVSCGDGVANAAADEDCDDMGESATCDADCTSATCGDGYVNALAGESCDDGVNDGSYDGCLVDCSGPAAFCGDGQVDQGEACDDGNDDSSDGCLSDCTVPKSCLEILTADAQAASGTYTVSPQGNSQGPLSVHCDMTSDGGGYTMLKVSPGAETFAPAAETYCAERGMQLFVPRSPDHLAAAFAVAMDAGIGPDASKLYLRILGIYPDSNGATCVFQPFRSDNASCNWSASDGQAFYVTDRTNIGEPNGDNATTQSMFYDWNDDGSVLHYNDLPPGYSSSRFMCDVGDKLP